jgi:hypothetical protein
LKEAGGRRQETEAKKLSLEFEYWDLFGIWILVFGI